MFRSPLNSLLLFLFLLLSSCSMFSPVTPAKKELYLINTLPASLSKKSTHSITLLVMPIQTRNIYNTTQMAYKIKPYQVNYFAKNEWAETPSQMFLPLLVRTLQKTKFFHAVVTPPYMGKYDYALKTDIIELQQDFIHKHLRFSVQVQINKLSTGKIIATRTFFTAVPLTENTPYGGVKAANKAAAKILRQISYFCIGHL